MNQPAGSLVIDDEDFDTLRELLLARSGLSLTREKKYLMESRLAPICRNRSIPTINALIQELRSNRAFELERIVVEAMTTNETLFFRDRIPFDQLAEQVLPQLASSRAEKRRLRIWCAAASTGQEPYSIAMILDEAAARFTGWRIDILATDLSSDVIEKAKRGVYSQFEVQRGLPVQNLLKYFKQTDEGWQISSILRERVEFRTLNLMRDFSTLGQFDIIVCRNVLIYFEQSAKTNVLNRLAQRLAPDGVLMLGAAETVIGLSDRLVPHSLYRGLYAHAAAAEACPPKFAVRS